MVNEHATHGPQRGGSPSVFHPRRLSIGRLGRCLWGNSFTRLFEMVRDCIGCLALVKAVGFAAGPCWGLFFGTRTGAVFMVGRSGTPQAA